ncbi:MAG TPA: DUF1761 domain-containing protein [Patescibacteria group bacterium]|nr:DUF1761 domain-containing protein [Patescibacteria group bacterium]
MPELDLNYAAIIVSVIASMILGMIWYSPAMFGNMWMKLSGLKKEDIKKEEANKGMFASAVAALVMAAVLSQFVILTSADTFDEGAKVAFWLWLGFVATVGVSEYIYTKRPAKLFVINMGYHLASMLLMGGILASWS